MEKPSDMEMEEYLIKYIKFMKMEEYLIKYMKYIKEKSDGTKYINKHTSVKK